MKKVFFVIIVASLFFVTGQVWAKGADDVEEVQLQIDESLKDYGNYLIEGNYDAWGKLHSEDVVKMPPNAPPTRNRADMVANSMKGGEFMKVVAMECNIQDTEVWGDRAFSWGLYTIELHPVAGGPSVFVDGKFLTLYEKTSNGKWIITHDCFNSNVPAQ